MSKAATASKPSNSQACSDCGNEFPLSRTTCPHCGRPQLFPNVALARDTKETQKVDSRLAEVVAKSIGRNCELTIQQFASACSKTVAVFTCPLEKLHREVATGTKLFETYHDLERLRLKTSQPANFDWAKLRPQAEIELLGSAEHLDKLHYACLSLDGRGLESYGDCTVVLADNMIAHRASCFEGNTAVIFAQNHDFSQFLRSDWQSRNKMCLAVGGDRIGASTVENDFPGILVECGKEAVDDRFIEVHVFGPMTAKTFRSVKIDATSHSSRQQVLSEAVQEKLTGITFEVVMP